MWEDVGLKANKIDNLFVVIFSYVISLARSFELYKY